MHTTQYGPGDSQTWGPITTPRDPRCDVTDEDAEAAITTMAEAILNAWGYASANHPMNEMVFEHAKEVARVRWESMLEADAEEAAAAALLECRGVQ